MITVLEREARLVRGCWVLNSVQACKGDERLANVRDYMLLKWVDSEYLDRDMVTNEVLLLSCALQCLIVKLISLCNFLADWAFTACDRTPSDAACDQEAWIWLAAQARLRPGFCGCFSGCCAAPA